MCDVSQYSNLNLTCFLTNCKHYDCDMLILYLYLTLFLASNNAWIVHSFLLTKSKLPVPFSSTVANSDARRSGISKLLFSTAIVEQPSNPSSFENFDYLNKWYPVSFSFDIPLNKPTQVTLFDVDYVITRVKNNQGEDEMYALLDRCPHKSASLSEGRVIESQTEGCSIPKFQCAYHGWSFDGKNGTCVEIPQVLSSAGFSGDAHRSYGTLTNGVSVPILIQQDIVWLFPGGNLEKALLVPPPPRVPELDEPGFKMINPFVRDFPIDWTLLIENIMDPDHGVFAHQNAGFDLYTASKGNPYNLTESFCDNGWILRGHVSAVEKVLKYDKSRRKNPSTRKESANKEMLTGTITFNAPTNIRTARIRSDGSVFSQIQFWILPIGTGKSRLLTSLISDLKLSIPRWIGTLAILKFLDQDTHLLATQQKYVLENEAQNLSKKVTGDHLKSINPGARRNLFVYRSPTDVLQQRVSSFFDQTLHLVPNREKSIKRYLHASNEATPPRKFTLDRYEQHTKICPDSLKCVSNCKRIKTLSKVMISFVSLLNILKVVSIAKIPIKMNSLVTRTTIVLFALAHMIAQKVERQFVFNYPEKKRDRDLRKISDLWMNPN